MGLLDIFKNVLYGNKRSAWDLSSTTPTITNNSTLTIGDVELKQYTQVGMQGLAQAPEVDLNLLQTVYRRNELVYYCINILSQSVQDPELIVEEKSGNGDWQRVEGHPLTQLFLSPNPDMDQGALLEAWVVSDFIAGIFYAEIVRDKNTGFPAQLFPLNPTKISANIKNGTVVSYLFKDGNYRQEIPVENMLVQRMYDPGNKFSGLAPLAVAMGSVDSDTAQTDYVRAFFKNAGMPSGLLKVKNKTLTDDQSNRIKEQWYMKYGLKNGKAGDVAVLDENADYVKLGSGLNELDSQTLRGIAESRICMVFNIPPMLVGAMVGLQHSTYSNMREARKGLWDNNLTPLFRSKARFINWRLLQEYETKERILLKQVRANWDLNEVAALQEDVDSAQNRARSNYSAGLITLNEARAKLGEQPDPSGEYYRIGLTFIPYGTMPTTPSASASMKPVIQGKYDYPKISVPETEIRNVKLLYSPIQNKIKDLSVTLKEKSIGRYEKRIERKLKPILLKQFEKAASHIRETWKSTIPTDTKEDSELDPYGINWDNELDKIKTVLKSEYPDILGEGFNDGVTILGLLLEDFNLDNEDIVEVEDVISVRAKLITQTTKDTLHELVQAQAQEGQSIPELAEAIKEKGITASDNRATTIARTETAYAYSAGSIISYKKSGVVDSIEWLVYNPCKECEPLTGVKVKIGEAFKTNVFHPPLHPNCRCAISPVLKGEE